MIPGQGIADLSSFAQAQDTSAEVVWIPVVPAAHVLTQITANGGRIADLGSSHGTGSLNKYLTTLAKKGRLRDVRELRQSAYLQYSTLVLDVIEI